MYCFLWSFLLWFKVHSNHSSLWGPKKSNNNVLTLSFELFLHHFLSLLTNISWVNSVDFLHLTSRDLKEDEMNCQDSGGSCLNGPMVISWVFVVPLKPMTTIFFSWPCCRGDCYSDEWSLMCMLLWLMLYPYSHMAPSHKQSRRRETLWKSIWVGRLTNNKWSCTCQCTPVFEEAGRNSNKRGQWEMDCKNCWYKT